MENDKCECCGYGIGLCNCDGEIKSCCFKCRGCCDCDE